MEDDDDGDVDETRIGCIADHHERIEWDSVEEGVDEGVDDEDGVEEAKTCWTDNRSINDVHNASERIAYVVTGCWGADGIRTCIVGKSNHVVLYTLSTLW